MEVMPDHVRLLVEVGPRLGVHRLVKTIKGRSSRLPMLCTNGYFVATIEGAPLEAIKQYVHNQKSR